MLSVGGKKAIVALLCESDVYISRNIVKVRPVAHRLLFE